MPRMRRRHQAGQGDRPRRVRQVGSQALCRRVGRRPAVGTDVWARREARAAPVFAARCRGPPHAVPSCTSRPPASGRPLPCLLTPPPPPRAPAPTRVHVMGCTGPRPVRCTRPRRARAAAHGAPLPSLRGRGAPAHLPLLDLPAMPPARRRRRAAGRPVGLGLGALLDNQAPLRRTPRGARGAALDAMHPPPSP